MKRSKGQVTDITEHTSVLLLDIEGTTTSISFVKNELFPYVRREVRKYLQRTWETELTRQDVAELCKQIEEDVTGGVSGSKPVPNNDDKEVVIAALVANVEAMMDADRKVAPLKTLQGHMWRAAYQEGAVTGHVYDDVVPALKKWSALGKRIYIYSSGSVEAQKLLFAHSCHGDLLHFFSGHFDTTVGPKVEAQSYRSILSQLDCVPGEVLFLTDVDKEAYAAAEAGMQVLLSVREGTAPLPQACLDTFNTITSFAELFQDDFDSPPSPKRSKVEAAGDGKKDGETDTLGKKAIKRNGKALDSRKDEGQSEEKKA